MDAIDACAHMVPNINDADVVLDARATPNGTRAINDTLFKRAFKRDLNAAINELTVRKDNILVTYFARSKKYAGVGGRMLDYHTNAQDIAAQLYNTI